MKTNDDVDKLEKLIGQLNGLQAELSSLAKKSPNDGLNLFKMKLVNKVLQNANNLLVGGYVPFEDFTEFTEEQLPTNSDVTLILAQYLEQVERYRSANVVMHNHSWVYVVAGNPSDMNSRPPTKIGANRE